MKKFLFLVLSIFGIGLLFDQCFGYDVIIYGEDNQLLFMYEVEEGTTEITLNGNWSKNGNDFTFLDGFNGTDVSYIDGFGQSQTINVKNDLYLNGNYNLGYTGEQYLMLTDSDCGAFEGYKEVFEVTGSTQPLDTEENIFNNFGDNALKVLLSNIPAYFQYFIIFSVIIFIIGLIKLFRRRK